MANRQRCVFILLSAHILLLKHINENDYQQPELVIPMKEGSAGVTSSAGFPSDPSCVGMTITSR